MQQILEKDCEVSCIAEYNAGKPNRCFTTFVDGISTKSVGID